MSDTAGIAGLGNNLAKILQESGGPTDLDISAIADGEFLQRSGGLIVGSVPAGAGDVVGPAGAVAGHIAVYGSVSGKLLASAGVPATDIAGNTAHTAGDGSDHADVATNTAHSGGDGSDHADVAANTAHSAGTGLDHSAVAAAAAHVVGDGSDHSDVAANTVHAGSSANPHSVTAAQAGADPSGTAATAVSGHESGFSHPTADEKAALAGTGTPAAGNKYVNEDYVFAGAGADGLVPDPTAETGAFLRDDGSWSTPAGAGDVAGPAGAVADNLASYNGATGKIIKDSGVDPADIGTNTTHRTGDGSDHSDVAANTVHASSDGSGHSDVAANTVHSGGDGSDHSDVAANTVHAGGDGSDHADVASNTVHSGGDGSDHADVAANTTLTAQATTTARGTLEVATPAEMRTGTDNVRALTPAAATDMVAATGGAAGERGMVPQPAAGEQGQFLRGDGTWATPAGGGGGGDQTRFYQTDHGANVGDYRVRATGSSATYRHNFQVPDDFDTLVSLEVIGQVTGGGSATADIDLYSDYGAEGQDAAVHDESDTTSTYDMSAASGTQVAVDVSSVFSALAAGDWCGLQFDQNSVGTTFNIYGIKLVYTPT